MTQDDIKCLQDIYKSADARYNLNELFNTISTTIRNTRQNRINIAAIPERFTSWVPYLLGIHVLKPIDGCPDTFQVNINTLNAAYVWLNMAEKSEIKDEDIFGDEFIKLNYMREITQDSVRKTNDSISIVHTVNITIGSEVNRVRITFTQTFMDINNDNSIKSQTKFTLIAATYAAAQKKTLYKHSWLGKADTRWLYYADATKLHQFDDNGQKALFLRMGATDKYGQVNLFRNETEDHVCVTAMEGGTIDVTAKFGDNMFRPITIQRYVLNGDGKVKTRIIGLQNGKDHQFCLDV